MNVVDTYHHYPNEKESVTAENDDNWKFTKEEIKIHLLKERAVFDNVITVGWLVVN